MYVLKEPQELSFNKVGIKGKIFPMRALTASTQFFLVETETGHETTIIEHESDFIYYVLEGNGYFEINNAREDCVKGDLIVIPKGTAFTYKGNLKMIASSTPPWKAEQEEVI